MRIGELARRAGVTTRTVRYYEGLGLLVSRREGGGHRQYDEDALARMAKIDWLKRMGLTLDEIAEVIAAYAAAARRAQAAGFDAVEVHGANGYLIDQFLQSGTNLRDDDYGGSAANRARFLVEVTRAVIDAFGPHRVGVRLSPGGTFNDMSDADSIETFGHAAAMLGELPCAYLHVVENRVGDQSATDLMRRHFRGALISCGGYDRASAIAAVDAGRADAIAFARHYISNPDLVDRLRDDWPLAAGNRKTYYGGSDAGYTDYSVYAANAT